MAGYRKGRKYAETWMKKAERAYGIDAHLKNKKYQKSYV